MRNRLIVVSGLHRNVVDFRSDILRQVVQQDVVDARRDATRAVLGMERGLPLHKTGRRNFEFGPAGEIDSRPGLQLRSGLSTLPLRA